MQMMITATMTPNIMTLECEEDELVMSSSPADASVT